MELEHLPKMAQNWTSKIKVFVSPNMEITTSYQNELSKLGIPIYRGVITNVNHTNSKVDSVSLESGEKIEVGTLLWIPSKQPSPLIQRLVKNFGLELNGIYVQDGLIWLHFIGGNHISCIRPGMADLLLWSYYWF